MLRYGIMVETLGSRQYTNADMKHDDFKTFHFLGGWTFDMIGYYFGTLSGFVELLGTHPIRDISEQTL